MEGVRPSEAPRYGRQFTPEKSGCGLRKFSPTHQFMGMASLAFRETTASDVSNATASVAKIASAARDMFINSDQFAEQFEQYLHQLAARETAGPTDPLAPVDDDSNRLTTP